MNNIEAVIIVPPCETEGIQPITLSVGGAATNAFNFDYTPPTPPGVINSILPNSRNPVLKGTLEVFGSGFGTNASALRVDLANSSGKVYPMRILVLNDTYIKVGVSGGLAGVYKVQVNFLGIGEASVSPTNANVFTYELIINSVTPSSGSIHGGTLISVKGINFSPAAD